MKVSKFDTLIIHAFLWFTVYVTCVPLSELHEGQEQWHVSILPMWLALK